MPASDKCMKSREMRTAYYLPSLPSFITGLPFLYGSAVKESACNVGDLDSIPGFGRSFGGGHDNPPCLENPMDRGAWWATVYDVAKSWT